MFSLVTSAASVFLAAALLLAGQMLLSTNLSLRMAMEGFSPGTISLVMIHNSFGFMLGSYFGPRLIRRVGHIRAFSAFAALMCCAVLMQASFVSAPLWAGLRATQGFCSALLMVALESWVNAHARPETRSRFMGLYMINYYVAGAAGQFLVSLNEPTDFRAFSLAAALLVAALIPLCLTSRAAPTMTESGRLAFGDLIRASSISVFGAGMSGFALASFYQLSPIYVQHLGASTQTVAVFMASAMLGSMLLQYPVGRLSDRFDRRRVIFGIALGIALSSALVGVLGARSMLSLFVGSILFTATSACLYPACLTRLNDRTGGQQHVAANASLLLCHGIGQCVGPLTVAGAMSLIGPSGLYFTVTAAMLIFATYTAWNIRTQGSRVTEPQPYVAVPADTTPTIAQLDPRAAEPEPPSAPGGDRMSTP
ncbi:MAG: MFS transporter [Panacagrimonas sp.]